MAVTKVIELNSASEKSFEDALVRGIERASQTIDDIKGAWVKEQKVVVENGKVREHRVDLKISFLLHAQ